MLRNFGMLPLYLRVSLFVTAAMALVMIGVLAGTAAAEQDRDEARIHGARQAWAVIDECYEAPTDCDAILAEVNGDGDGVRFFEDGSAYLVKDGRK
jgi:hypothetical protein